MEAQESFRKAAESQITWTLLSPTQKKKKKGKKREENGIEEKNSKTERHSWNSVYQK